MIAAPETLTKTPVRRLRFASSTAASDPNLPLADYSQLSTQSGHKLSKIRFRPKVSFKVLEFLRRYVGNYCESKAAITPFENTETIFY